MKKATVIVLSILTLSCNFKKNNSTDIKNIQEIFKIKGNVKEIQEKIISSNFYYHSVTTFDRDGSPTETIQYNKNGKVESREPWTRLTKEEEELSKKNQKNEYDSQKRLIRQIEIYNGKESETVYKYNESGKKTEEIKKFADRKIQSLYNSNGLLKEVIISDLGNGKFYWQSKEKYIYNKNHYLIEKQVYRNQDENHIFNRDLYEYDNIGSLVKTTTHYTDGNMPEVKNRKIIYY